MSLSNLVMFGIAENVMKVCVNEEPKYDFA